MYILKVNDKAFVKEISKEIVLTADYTKAVSYEKIGDAMTAAAMVNEYLGIPIVKIA